MKAGVVKQSTKTGSLHLGLVALGTLCLNYLRQVGLVCTVRLRI